MNILSFENFYEEKSLLDEPLSISIGVFDGVHAGHELLIRKICSYPETKSAVITFRRNPKSVLYGDTFPGDITTKRQKLNIFRSIKIDYIIMIDFSSEFSRYTGKQFLSMITSSADVKHVVVGENFHCGKGGAFSSGDVRDFLTSRGINVEIIPSLLYDDKHRVSSSKIRSAVLKGDFQLIDRLMNRAYSLDTAMIPQYQRDEAMYYIVKEHISQPLPPPGKYRARCLFQDRSMSDIVDITIDADHIIVPSEGQLDELVFVE